MKATFVNLASTLRQWLTVLSLGTALAATAAADVTLTATSPAGSTELPRGSSFTVDLTWSGTPVIAAADYAVTLSTSQIACTGRTLDASLTYADTPYQSAYPVSTNLLDVTWYKGASFIGKDMTLNFTIPADYSGPSDVTIGLVIAGVQDATATAIASSAVGTTIHIVNNAPTISDVADQSTNEDTATTAIPFTIGDVETPAASLAVSGTSSNTTLVPSANIVFGGSGTSRTATVTPALNQYGSTTITLSVSDGSNTTSDTFVLTVNAANDAPTISDVANQATNTSTATAAIPFTVGDAETAAADLGVTATSSNPTVVPDSNIVLGGTGANRIVTVTPVTGVNGTTTITLTVSDGTLTATDTFVLTVSTPVVMTTYTWAKTGSGTSYSWLTPANWTANNGYPNATNHTAVLSTAGGDLVVTLDAPITVGGISSVTGTLNLSNGTGGGPLTFDNGNSMVDTVNFNAPLRYRLYLSANMVLNDNLNLTYSSVNNSSGPYIQGVVSGAGNLTVNYSSSATLALGAAAGAANTHQGGTTLIGATSVRNMSAAKANVVGSGALSLDRINLQLASFAQTFAGLNGGSNSAVLTASGSPTVTLNGSGDYAYSGAISGGITLAKSGSGAQVLSGVNGYTGATNITGGSLLVNGSLAIGSAVTVGPNGTLGGTGTVSGSVNNQGMLSPGASVGTLTTGAVTMAAGSQAQFEFADWAGSTPGTSWDALNCASLALSGTPANRIVIKLLPLSLINFTEATKTFTIATSAADITGFDATAISINSSAMPGTGIWSAQLDGTKKLLQLVYTVTATPYGSWATIKGLSEANKAPELDPDNDGSNNMVEFAFNGDPVKASNNGLFATEGKDTTADGDANQELVFTCAVRRGTVFSASAGQAQVSAAIDGIVYTIEGGANLAGLWDGVISNVGASDTPPAGSGLPDLTGTAWEYRSFSAFNGLAGSGFLRAKVTSAP